MKKFLLFLIAVSIVMACNEEDLLRTTSNETTLSAPADKDFSEDNIVKGFLRIKFKTEPTVQTSATAHNTIHTENKAFNQTVSTLRITRMERTFPYNEKYEERTRKEGMHLWYNVWYDPNVSATRAVNEIMTVNNIDLVCPMPKVHTRSVSYPWNDPYLPNQWNLINPGSENWQIAHADIRISNIWKQYNGNPRIIIAVIDEGVDTRHPDLQANLWTNPNEIPGNGIDDDGNGYIDDVHGYNFIQNTPYIQPMEHATHVAGIIGAANHNGIGISGIAGGDGTPNSGAKLMCCQILDYGTENAGAAAIKYAADNGAVICQNSWGYTGTIAPVDKEAIDYFIKYAGCDNEGNQLPESPMKGGIVLFATNNHNSSNPSDATPADYEEVIGVASIRADYQKSSFSDYGDYIDICAPGGENRRIAPSGVIEKAILSTIANQGYDYLFGASMACPHVSGVAALIIEKYGLNNPGFTPGQLKDILLGTAYNIDEYNPQYAGMLGSGCVNAEAALSTEKPNEETNIPGQILLKHNPITDGVLAFKISKDLIGNAKIIIYNSIGRKVYEQTSLCKQYIINKINIQSLSAGYYVLEYRCNGISIKKRFIKY